MPEPTWTRYVPYGLAGAAALGGVILALWVGDDDGPAPSPSATVSASADVSASASVPLPSDTPPYEPDLSGKDIGSVIVEGASAHAMGIVSKRLHWMSSDGAVLSSSRLDGGEVRQLWSESDDNYYGGELVFDRAGLFFSIGTVDDEMEPIHFIDRSALLEEKPAIGDPLLRGASPANLWAFDGELYFSDLGNIQSRKGKLASRDKRIVALTGCYETLYWLEAPYEGAGSHALMSMPAQGGEPVALVESLGAKSRSDLRCARGYLVWAEPDGIYAIPRQGGKPSRKARTGLVTALDTWNERIAWAEVHGEGDDAVSVIRELTLPDGEPARAGRDRGTITTLEIAKVYLFWSGARGIKRYPFTAM